MAAVAYLKQQAQQHGEVITGVIQQLPGQEVSVSGLKADDADLLIEINVQEKP